MASNIKKLDPLRDTIPQWTQYLGQFTEDPQPTEAGQWWYNITERAQKYFDGKTVRPIGTGIQSLSSGGLKITNIWWDDQKKEIVIVTE